MSLLDNNECLDKQGGCAQNCVNVDGSYYCECTEEGYVLADDKHDCLCELSPFISKVEP